MFIFSITSLAIALAGAYLSLSITEEVWRLMAFIVAAMPFACY